MVKEKNRHKYSTYTLMVFLALLIIAAIGSALSSDDINALCNLNDSFLYKSSGTWGCGQLDPSQFNITYTNITLVQTNKTFIAEDFMYLNGTNSLVNYFDFNTSDNSSAQEGRLHWHSDDGTLGLGMPGGTVELQIGQESLIKVVNKLGSTIPDGKVVYITGAQGNIPTVGLADRTDSDKLHIAGITTESIADNQNGYVTINGLVRDIDTTGTPVGETWTDGDNLYLATNGNMTNSHPSSSIEGVIIVATVIRSHATEGVILVTAPESFTIGNNFNGTLRQSIMNKNTGTNAAVGFTAVNNLGHFTTIGIAGSNNVNFPNEVSVYYAPGYGDHWQAVDGNKDFVWFIDPTDSHNNSALNHEVMRLSSTLLNVTQDVNIEGNFTGNQIYGELTGSDIGDTTFASSNIYYNITNVTLGHNNGVSNANSKMQVLISGTYKVTSAISFSGGANTEYHMALGVNGVVTEHCHAERKIGTGGDVGSMSLTCIDVFDLNDNLTIMTENVDNTNSITIESINLNILRVGN